MNNNELAASIASQVAQTKVYAKGDSVFITLTRDPFDSKAWATYKEAIAYVKDAIAAHGVKGRWLPRGAAETRSRGGVYEIYTSEVKISAS